MPLHANVYRYDRLNRIKGMDVYHGAPATDLSALANNNDYRTAYSYDPNGNLLTLERNAHGSNRDMDRFTYHYTAGTNQLEYVDDTQPAANWPDDLDDQNLDNYEYDLKGRLTKDALAGIGQYGIAWTLHDKVRSVTRETTSDLDELHFRYGPMGHRTVKEVRPRIGGNTTTEDQWTTTYYIHDAQGNPMAIYRRSYQPTQAGTYRDQLMADGLPVYGSARLGMNQRPSLYRPEFSTTGFDGLHFAGRSYTQMPSPWVADDHAARTLGLKAYELANHLGNVLTTVSDRRMAVPDAGNPSLLDSYLADVRSVSDYYPFGSLLPGRHENSSSSRYLFQGQEHDDEINGAVGTSYAFEYRIHNPLIGRMLSIDPLAAQYPWNSPYAFSENRVIDAIELEGLEAVRLADQEVKNGTLTILKVPGVFAVAHTYQNTTTASAVTQQGPNQTTVSESFWAKAVLWWDGKAPLLTSVRAIFSHTINPQSPYNWAIRQFQTMPTHSNGTKTRAYWGNVNVYTHIVGQAFAAALFGSDNARFVGDMHERIPAEAAKFNGDMNSAGWGIEYDGARDLINNEYGRALGIHIMADWQAQNCGPLDEGFSAFFLNRVHEYLINTFPDMAKYLRSDYPNDDANLAGFTARWQQAYRAYLNGEW
jgi:RHS repeat-associated protein